MKITGNAARIGLATVVILGTVAWLATTGYKTNKSYYVTIAELGGLGDKAYHDQLRVEGFVVPGTIQQNGTNVTFTMNEFESHNPKAAKGRIIQVEYKGSEPPPDTFKDDSQALAIGTYGYDGKVHASALQAKCASKYAPAGPNQPAVKPAAPKSTASASSAPQAKPAV
jgi:cytochrome c-type biogenesis protein CcmE